MKKNLSIILALVVIFTCMGSLSSATSASEDEIKMNVKVYTDMGFEEENFSFEHTFQKSKQETEILAEISNIVKSKLKLRQDRIFYGMEMINYEKNKTVTFMPYSLKNNIVDKNRNILSSVKEVLSSDELYSVMMEDLTNSLRNSKYNTSGSLKYLTFSNIKDGTLTKVSLINDDGVLIREESVPSTKTVQISLTEKNYDKMNIKFTYYNNGNKLDFLTSVDKLKKLQSEDEETIKKDSGLKYAYILDGVLVFNYSPETFVRDRGGFYWRQKGDRFIEEYNNGFPRYRRDKYDRFRDRFDDLFNDFKNFEFDPENQYHKNDYMIEVPQIPCTIQVVLVEESGKEIPMEFKVKKNNYLLTESAPPYWSKLKMSAFEKIAERDTGRVIELKEKDKVNLIDIFEPQIVYEFETDIHSKNMEVYVNDELIKNYRRYQFESGVSTVVVYNKKIDKEFRYFVIVDDSQKKTDFEVKKTLQFNNNINFREAVKLSDKDFKLDSKYEGFLVVYKNQAYTLEDSVKIEKSINKVKFDIYYKGKKYTVNASRIIRNNLVLPKYNNEFIFPSLGERKK